ncbi:MAG: serine hydrolase [Gaiellaceae bacterium]
MIAVTLDHVEPPPRLDVRLRRPALTAPAPRQVSWGRVAGFVGAGAERVLVKVDGVLRGSQEPVGGRFELWVDLPKRDVRVRVVAENAAGERKASVVTPVYGLPRAGRPTGWRPATEDAALARRLRGLVRDHPGIAAVFVQDLRTRRGAAWNARARFPAASTVKLAIAAEVLRRLRGLPPRDSSVDRLLWAMLVYSDNAAANALLEWIGGSTSVGASRVTAMLRSLGISDTGMYGGYLTGGGSRPIPLTVEEQPSFVGKYTSAWDLAQLHTQVHTGARGLGRLVRLEGSFTPADARYLLWVLAHVTDRDKLDRYLPGRVAVLHKAGWITEARHDAGLVYWRGGSYVAAVMTWSSAGAGASSDVLAGRVALAALRRFQELRLSVQADLDGSTA